LARAARDVRMGSDAHERSTPKCCAGLIEVGQKIGYAFAEMIEVVLLTGSGLCRCCPAPPLSSII